MKSAILVFSLISAFLLSVSAAVAQTGKVRGTIRTIENKGIEWARIQLKGTSLGAVSNQNGEFSFAAPVGDYAILISMVGYAGREQNIRIEKDEILVLNFVLEESPLELNEVMITGVRAITGMGYLAESNDHVIYSGKKTEVLLLDSLDANTAQNNPRQVLGRVPGANYSETEGNGFPSNGIGFRGLNPTQSVETNTRQNGYNITADLYGYPESYYLPTLEAVQRIEVTRGASALPYGPQFGGVINYIMKRGNPAKHLEFTTQQTTGSFGLFSTFNSLGGQTGKLNYYGYGQFQSSQGWRPNSDFRKFTGYAQLEYQASDKIKFGIEYSILRNRIHMPGGLTDSLFNTNSRSSTRTRNWIQSPWNILVATVDWKLSSMTSLSIKSSFNLSSRSLVWRNEDGGPQAPDNIDPVTHEYDNREVSHETFQSHTTEVRLLSHYKTGKTSNTLASGIRFFSGTMGRQGGGKGTTGTDFDLSLVTPGYGYDLDFTTLNVAPFIENKFGIGDRVSVTPGFRYEFIKSSIKGFSSNEAGNGIINSDEYRIRHILLAGVGAQFKSSATTNIYANWSQSYRPFDYSSLSPLGTIASVDPKLKDSNGYTADVGFRGSVKDFLTFDVSGFYLKYNNRVGVIEKPDAFGNFHPYRTNIANSVHQGLETYVEFSPTKALGGSGKWNLSFFNSLALIDAKYVSGKYSGNYVEYAPTCINRFGTTLGAWMFSTTFLISRTAKSFGDADNSKQNSADAVTGIIPANTVIDWSSKWSYHRYNVKFGINNLADHRYFTKRTDEYPGPGIIPSLGRSFYFSVGAKF